MKKKVICIVVVVIIMAIYIKHKYYSFPFNEGDVKSIDVMVTQGLNQAYYCSNPKFTVVESRNIECILNAIKAGDDRGKRINEERTSQWVEAEITINLKDGVSKTYSLTTQGLNQDKDMAQALNSKEVVQQIRSAFTIDLNTVRKVEFYYWGEENTEKAKCELIKDRSVIEKILQIAKCNVVADADKSMESTKCGFQFSDENGTVKLIINIYPGMEGYNELLKIKPSISEDV